MFELNVNGTAITAQKDEKLLAFLRDALDLTSVKNGCSQGACGTCMVLVDGKAIRACILTTAKVVGKKIITCEGLSQRERNVYGYAFSHAGAVQCGFCTPGMVISAKSLLDTNLNPTSTEVKEAIKFNICRCTGYKKIIDAILLAAQLMRDHADVPHHDFTGVIGEPMHRVDAETKALGDAEYADDLHFDGMLFGSAVRSKHPRALIKAIDVSAAKAVDGVRAVITAAELPGTLYVGHLRKDQYVLVPIGSETHFLGDGIALIAAETREALEAAKRLVEVEYEVLTPILSPTEAMAEGAPNIHETGNLLVHEKLVRGDADKAIQNSKFVVTTKYQTPFTEHAFLEPETAVAVPEGNGVIIYTGDQGIYQTRHECAEATGLPEESVRVIAKMVGGGFGGKEDMSVQHHAAILALATRCPVKVSLTRDESLLIHPKRHPMTMEFTTACDENGLLTGLRATIISDTGAYASLGGPVLQRACTHAAGPYNYHDVHIDGYAYYTNNPPAGPFRGFGVTQSCFATECNLNQLAEKVGVSPFEIRYRNAIRPRQVLPNGQIADDSTALVETLDAVRSYYEANPKVGIACALKNSGLGVGIPDTGRCRIIVKNKQAHVYSSAACIGQGMGTVLVQVLCETTGLSPEQVVYHDPDTSEAPNSGNTTASRQTLFTGEAGRRAALELKHALTVTTLAELNGREFYGEYLGITDKMGGDKPNPTSHIAYGYATHLVELDDNGMLKKVIAVHDVGKAVNPITVEGQIEGGVVMSLGYALTEDFPLENGKPTLKFGTLGLMRSTQVPEIESIIVEKSNSELACGAKGIGEICSIPTPPAVQLAYYNYDGIFRTSLPLSDTPYSRKKSD